jgi:hypothetical protein
MSHDSDSDVSIVDASQIIPAMESACLHIVQNRINPTRLEMRVDTIQKMVREVKQQITTLEAVFDGLVYDMNTELLYGDIDSDVDDMIADAVDAGLSDNGLRRHVARDGGRDVIYDRGHHAPNIDMRRDPEFKEGIGGYAVEVQFQRSFVNGGALWSTMISIWVLSTCPIL